MAVLHLFISNNDVQKCTQSFLICSVYPVMNMNEDMNIDERKEMNIDEGFSSLRLMVWGHWVEPINHHIATTWLAARSVALYSIQYHLRVCVVFLETVFVVKAQRFLSVKLLASRPLQCCGLSCVCNTSHWFVCSLSKFTSTGTCTCAGAFEAVVNRI